jgi:cytochrome c peroxidase
VRFLASLALILVLGVCSAIVYIVQSPVPVPDWLSNPVASFALARGENPNPVTLNRPAAAPLSAMALLGQQIFNDTSLSSSGKLSCASCHSAADAYAPANKLPA